MKKEIKKQRVMGISLSFYGLREIFRGTFLLGLFVCNGFYLVVGAASNSFYFQVIMISMRNFFCLPFHSDL